MILGLWISPHGINQYIETNKVSEAVRSFLQNLKKDFPIGHAVNIFNLLEKWSSVSFEEPYPLLNNTVAFYFKEGLCTHASRYIIELGWVSKLGEWLPITHDINDLTEKYGNNLVYLVVLGDLESIGNDEEL